MVGLKGLTGKKIIPIFIGVYNTSQGIFFVVCKIPVPILDSS